MGISNRLTVYNLQAKSGLLPAFVWNESWECFLHFKWWGKVKRGIIFCEMRKIHKLQISLPINKFFMLHSQAPSFAIIYGCCALQRQSTELQQTRCGPHRLKYLLSGPLQKSFADPCSYPICILCGFWIPPCVFLLSCPCSHCCFIVLLTVSICQNTIDILRPNSDASPPQEYNFFHHLIPKELGL